MIQNTTGRPPYGRKIQNSEEELQEMILATEHFIENKKGQKLHLIDISNLRRILRMKDEKSIPKLIMRYDLNEISFNEFVEELERYKNDN